MTAKKAAKTTAAAPKARKPRPSRSKAAVAARAIAKAQETGDWEQVSDATLAAAGPYTGMTAPQAEREIAEIDAHLADPEVVRALADVDVQSSAADQFAEGVSDSTWDFMADVEEREAAALGVTPEMQHQTLLAYYDRVRELEAESVSLESRLKDAISAAEIFDRLLGEEKARNEELEASTERSLKTLREQKEAAIAERDAARAELSAIRGSRQFRIEDQQRLAGCLEESERMLKATNEQVIACGAELDAAEERIDYLEAELAHARRPWIAKLLGRA